MAAIRLLDESIAQKIAAGEVVERPASVIKELVENSIDAGSTFVTVDIKEGGIERMRVTDNGCGIPAAEVELAFLRHATSKIQSLDDLYDIRQMGFRGEALYSVAAVTKLELTTKPAAEPSGTRLVIHGGKTVSCGEYGCPDGTTIVADNLFYNTPARLKFLNKPGIEAGYVGSVVMRHILANPGISLKFINNDKVVYHSAGDGNLKNAIYSIFGRETAKGLIPIREEAGSITVDGYLFSPADAHGNRGRGMLMVNRRPVNHFAIGGIIERAYAGLTDAKRFPGYVLNIALPFSEVDVNVHPNKLQVRFTNESAVKQAVEFAVSKVLDHYKSKPIMWAFKNNPEPDGGEGEGPEETERPVSPIQTRPAQPQPVSWAEAKPQQPKPAAESPRESTEPPKPKVTIGETVQQYTQDVRMALRSAGLPVANEPAPVKLMQRPSIVNTAVREEPPEQLTLAEKKEPVRTIGQVFNTYALIETGDKLLIVDQHAAHERLLYDRYVERIKSEGVCSQKLLIPQVVNVSHEVKAVIDENMPILESLGFELEEYGRLSFQIRAVPFILGQPQVQDIIFELVDILSDDRSVRTDELKREKLMSMACKKAVKAGDRLSSAELDAVAAISRSEDSPLTCPHGRPFVIVLDRHSMEKQFKRVK